MNEDMVIRLKDALRKVEELIPHAPSDFIKNELKLSIKDLYAAISLVETGPLDDGMLNSLNESLSIIDMLYNKHASN